MRQIESCGHLLCLLHSMCFLKMVPSATLVLRDRLCSLKDCTLDTSVSEWKYIIASAFKFKLLHQLHQPSNSNYCVSFSHPDRNSGYILALPIIARATASWAETSGAWWIFLLSCTFGFSIAVSR